ncbi:hypothetical protein F2Q70_00007766 [Brassica cretica]|uniref:Peptidase C1A papain C-terminal domain-containing protein n=1 Tax=Brassica cretica TaxID=69181 RepID=A0A8S9M3R3_BRACR|nr:hypothetical protein F2Q70_00007766 [Brassica cretica]
MHNSWSIQLCDFKGQTHALNFHSGNGKFRTETGETTELLARSEMRQVVELPMHSVAVGAVEAAYHQKYGIGTDLSEQQLIDCSFRVYGNHGCFRGLPSRAFDYIKAYGLILERDYEYISLQSVCRQLVKKPFVNITRYVNITSCRETGETTELLARSEMRQVVELPMHSVTVGAVEAAYHQKYGIGTDLSEQQLIDCSFRVYGNHGCFRGLPSRAFDYIKAYGLILERDYEYISLQSVCRQLDDEDELKQAVTSVSISFDTSEIRYYRSGVFTSNHCGNTLKDLRHFALAVGYGIENGVPYWLIKNSWGEDWGEGLLQG